MSDERLRRHLTDAPFMPGYLKTHWPNLLTTLIAMLLTGVFNVAVTVTTINSRLNRVEERVTALEKAQPEKIAWQAEQDHNAIKAMQDDARVTQANIAQINNTLSVLNTKMDAALDQLKRKQ